MDDEDNFTSITWETANEAEAAAAATGAAGPRTASSSSSTQPHPPPSSGVDLVLGTQSLADPYSRPPVNPDDTRPTWEGYLLVEVTEPRKEHEGTKDMFVSYGIRAETNLKHFSRSRLATRRRFQDFVFLRDNLARDFPACVVAPLPDKHRLGEWRRRSCKDGLHEALYSPTSLHPSRILDGRSLQQRIHRPPCRRVRASTRAHSD